MSKNIDFSISIRVVSGGFVLEYPVVSQQDDSAQWHTEVFMSPGKLHRKIKEVLEALSEVPAAE